MQLIFILIIISLFILFLNDSALHEVLKFYMFSKMGFIVNFRIFVYFGGFLVVQFKSLTHLANPGLVLTESVKK